MQRPFPSSEGTTIVRDEPKTFIEHLAELRKRIVISAFATAAGTAISFVIRDRLFDFRRGLLTLPLRLRPSDILAAFFGAISRAGVGSSVLDLFQLFFRSRASHADTIKLFSAAPLEKFMVIFKTSFAVGVLLAAPVILYQIWAFVMPALKQQEKRYLIPLFFIALFFFSIGAIFAFLVVAPTAMPVLAGLLPSIENQWRLEYYFSFVIRIMLAFGVAFELPIVMGFIARIGIFDAVSFRRKRKIAVVLIFIASAALTPQDPFTMLLMAIPLMGLYELGIRFAVLVSERNARMLSG
jgi:sec-independent protein translocase protein TatC